jgi:hypothetical protein
MLYGSAYDLPTPRLITCRSQTEKQNQSVELGRSYRVELQQHSTDWGTIKSKEVPTYRWVPMLYGSAHGMPTPWLITVANPICRA